MSMWMHLLFRFLGYWWTHVAVLGPASFRGAWQALRRFVAGENPVDDMPDRDTSPLDAPVERAGGVGRSGRLQRAMTAQVEQHARAVVPPGPEKENNAGGPRAVAGRRGG